MARAGAWHRLPPSLGTMELWRGVPPAWREPLGDLRDHIQSIGERLDERARSGSVLPAREQVFRALQVGPTEVSVAIVGQDPYPNPQHACGLSFSVPPGTRPLPGSLRNILAEVRADVGSSVIGDGDLQPWVDQGVMLLNRTLTVTGGAPRSHADLGWDLVTNRIVEVIASASPTAVALLWGADAQRLASWFPHDSVIATSHPSPLSVHRGFSGSRPFSAANRILVGRQRPAVRW